jgi:integrase
VSVYDRWHLAKAPKDPDARKCSQHRKYPSSEHGKGRQFQVRGEDQDGQPFRQSFEFIADANDKDAELRLGVKSGTFIDDRAGTVTLREFAEDWRKNRVHDPVTAARIKAEFENHVYSDTRPGADKGRTRQGGVAIGDYKMRVLARRVSLSQKWIRGLPLGANSAIKVIKDLSQVFKAAVADKIIAENPFSGDSLQRPAASSGDAVAWGLDRIEAVAAGLPEELQAMPYLGASCGHRLGELCGAAVEDIDFLRKTCAVEYQVKFVDLTGVVDATNPRRAAPLSGWHLVYAPVKNRKSRKGIPVAAPVILKLSEHLAARPAAAVRLPFLRGDGKLDGDLTRRLIFANRGRRPWYQGTLQEPWKRARKAAGIPGVAQLSGWHVLRHTFASQCLSSGLSLAKTAAFLGDTKEVVLAVYAHFMPADDDLARVIVNAFFAPPETGENARETTSAAPEGTLWPFGAACPHSRWE